MASATGASCSAKLSSSAGSRRIRKSSTSRPFAPSRTSFWFAACTQGKRVRFWSATAWVTHMLELRARRDLKRFLTQMEKQDLIILDELGYVPFSKAVAELIFEVVSRAYERLSLIVTTNLPFEQ